MNWRKMGGQRKEFLYWRAYVRKGKANTPEHQARATRVLVSPFPFIINDSMCILPLFVWRVTKLQNPAKWKDPEDKEGCYGHLLSKRSCSFQHLPGDEAAKRLVPLPAAYFMAGGHFKIWSTRSVLMVSAQIAHGTHRSIKNYSFMQQHIFIWALSYNCVLYSSCAVLQRNQWFR